MKDDIFQGFSSMGGSRSDYTLEQIEQAEKLKKKNGGTLMENLERVTSGKASDAGTSSAADLLSGSMAGLRRMTEELGKRVEAHTKASKAADSMEDQLRKNQDSLNKELENLTKNLREDFGIQPVQDDSWKKDFGLSQESAGVSAQTEAANAAEAAEEELIGEKALESFQGVTDEVEKTVFGQSEFIKKLVIAFKRPYVMPPEEPKALNTIFLTGKNDTGKHFALKETAKELGKRRILKNSEIRVMDLGLYPDASMEKLFLQDIYSALSSSCKIILFEHFENCHPSFLAHIGSLVTDGSFQLSERYVMQKGQLVNVQSSLAPETVSAFHASGKYLIFVTEKSLDKAAGIMGAPFINAIGDVCVTTALDADAIRKIAEGELEELKKNAAERFFFLLEFEDGFLDYSVTKSERQAGLKGVQDFYDSVAQALAQAKLEGDYAKDTELKIYVEDGRVLAKNGEEKIDLTALLPDGYRGEIDAIRKEMDEIVGLAKVKEYVFSLEEYYKVQKRRAEEGLKTGEVSKHMIFTGSPGTGKTTIARIISKYLKSIGVLTGGQLVEVSRADLVGRYVGHTAPLTNKVISSAIGGVLFIDEAYSLYRGKDDNFGLEAIDTLVKGIEDNRDNLIVILAGYSKEMQEFLTSNSGLKSRFPNVINFPDYTGEELLKISRSIAKSKGYVIDEGADPALCAYFNAVQAVRAADAGNGRLARNKIEEAILNQSKRLVAEPDAELSVLLSQDFDLTDIASDEK